MTNIGLQYNLLTQYTSFVAIDSEIRNDGGKQTAVTQPLPLPDGVSDMAVSGYAKSYGMMNRKAAEYSALKSVESERMTREELSIEEVNVVENVVDFDRTMVPAVHDNPEKMPEFIGGQTALVKFIMANLHLTEADLKKWKGEKMKVKFIVNADGTLTDIKITGTRDRMLRSRVLKIFLAMPKWIPGETGGQKVRIHTVVPITIK